MKVYRDILIIIQYICLINNSKLCYKSQNERKYIVGEVYRNNYILSILIFIHYATSIK